MSDLTFRRLSETNGRRLTRWHPPTSTPWSLADWANAMQGEAGEAGNWIKKLRRYETYVLNDPTGRTQQMLAAAAGLEIADTVIYADLLAQELQRRYPDALPLDELIVTKFNATSVREGFPERLPVRFVEPTPDEATSC